MTKTRIGVVRGGPSNEYDVSLKTGAAVLGALNREKYEPFDIVITKNGAWHMHGVEMNPHEILRRVDVVFNALHGHYGEDGKIQKMFEMRGMPHTSSGSLASAIAMTKNLAKDVFRRAGIKTPLHVLVKMNDVGEIDATDAYMLAHEKFPLPYIIKPSHGGSSLGISVVKTRENLAFALANAFEKSDSVLIEEFISGIEASVGVIRKFRGKELYTLPPIEIRKGKNSVFEYGMKYGGQSVDNGIGYKVEGIEEKLKTQNSKLKIGEKNEQSSNLPIFQSSTTLYTSLNSSSLRLSLSNDLPPTPSRFEIVPATFSPLIKKELERLAIVAHEALGLSHYSRSDFIVTPRRGIYILETNSLPGLTEESLVPKALAAVGSSLGEFVDHVIHLVTA